MDMQRIEKAALIVAEGGEGAMWAEEMLFQPLIRVVSWVLMRSDVDCVIFDGPEELREELAAVYPPDAVLTGEQAAKLEVGATIALPVPAFVSTDDVRELFGACATMGDVRLTRGPHTIAYCAPGLLTEQGVRNFDPASCVVDASDDSTLIVDFGALARAEDRANALVCRRLIRSGVRILRPQSVSIGADCIVERGATVLPGSIICHGSVIHSGAVVGPNTLIDNSEICSGTTVNQSQVYDSKIGRNTSVGPFAHVRPESSIGSDCRIGAFVEVKKSNIGNGTKSAHLTFIGDADVGDNVNFGCGTVISNYDGLKKHRTTIADEAFIGCNTNLIAPVKVGKGAYTAAGATVTKDVPDYALYIGRPEPVVKEGWAERVMALREKARKEKEQH